jgi:hypothetical protein
MRALLMALGISLCSFLVGVAGDLSGPSPVLVAQATASHSVVIALPPLRSDAFTTASAAAAEPRSVRRRPVPRPVVETPAFVISRHEIVTLVKPAVPLKLGAFHAPAKGAPPPAMSAKAALLAA